MQEEDFNVKFRSIFGKFSASKTGSSNPVLVENDNEANFDLFLHLNETKKSPNLASLTNVRLLLMTSFIGNFYRKK
jgi:hypothetical protein